MEIPTKVDRIITKKNFEESIFFTSKVIAKVKVVWTHRSTEVQREGQRDRGREGHDKNNMPPIYRCGGIKIF